MILRTLPDCRQPLRQNETEISLQPSRSSRLRATPPMLFQLCEIAPLSASTPGDTPRRLRTSAGILFPPLAAAGPQGVPARSGGLDGGARSFPHLQPPAPLRPGICRALGLGQRTVRPLQPWTAETCLRFGCTVEVSARVGTFHRAAKAMSCRRRSRGVRRFTAAAQRRGAEVKR